MSRENVKKFFELVKTEEQLARKVVELNEGMRTGKFSDENELIEDHILPLAKEYGLEFTVDEFLEYSQASVGELSDDMLLDVNGGRISPRAMALGLLATTAISFVPSIIGSFATGGGDSVPPVAETSISQTYEENMEDEDNDDDVPASNLAYEDDDTVTPQNSPIFGAQRRADAGGPGAFNMDEVMQKLRSVDGATAQPGSGVAETQATVDRNGAGDAAVETKLETQKAEGSTTHVAANKDSSEATATAAVEEEATKKVDEAKEAEAVVAADEENEAGAVVEDGTGAEGAGAVEASTWAPLVAKAQGDTISYANRVEHLLTGIDSYNELDEQSREAVNTEAGALKGMIKGRTGSLRLVGNGKGVKKYKYAKSGDTTEVENLQKIVEFCASHSL